MASRFPRRNTRQRQVVLEELRKLACHPTAAELYEFARQRLPKISLGTVYRNLEILMLEGLIRRLDSAGAEARFDGDVTDHHHVRCIHCGAVADVGGWSRNMTPVDVRHMGGYEILGYRLHFEGICPLCRDVRDSAGGGADAEAG